MLEIWEDPKWFTILAVGIALAFALGYSADRFADAQEIQSCVATSGDWVDTDPTRASVTMGCVHK